MPQRMTGVPSTPLHFIGNKTVWVEGGGKIKGVENREKVRHRENNSIFVRVFVVMEARSHGSVKGTLCRRRKH